MKRSLWVIATVCGLLLAVNAPVMAQPQRRQDSAARCNIQGSWLSQVDIGALFFTQYSGSTAAGGALTIEWVRMDPTLFGNFPAAVRITPAAGAWRPHGDGYEYSWISYGVDAAGTPLYSVKGSGTGSFDGCDTINFDYVLQVFPSPMNPLTDTPVTCLTGSGSKTRIPAARASCL